jgi:hypothetical protein
MECCTIGSAGLRACGTKHTHKSKSCGNLTVCCGKLPFIDDLPPVSGEYHLILSIKLLPETRTKKMEERDERAS